jgi:hypothetical protein
MKRTENSNLKDIKKYIPESMDELKKYTQQMLTCAIKYGELEILKFLISKGYVLEND